MSHPVTPGMIQQNNLKISEIHWKLEMNSELRASKGIPNSLEFPREFGNSGEREFSPLLFLVSGPLLPSQGPGSFISKKKANFLILQKAIEFGFRVWTL